jgi:hypothetical protein
MVFFQVFLLSPLQCTVAELQKLQEVALHEFEEIQISRQSCRGD